jgi:hypothetical protein
MVLSLQKALQPASRLLLKDEMPVLPDALSVLSGE